MQFAGFIQFRKICSFLLFCSILKSLQGVLYIKKTKNKKPENPDKFSFRTALILKVWKDQPGSWDCGLSPPDTVTEASACES